MFDFSFEIDHLVLILLLRGVQRIKLLIGYKNARGANRNANKCKRLKLQFSIWISWKLYKTVYLGPVPLRLGVLCLKGRWIQPNNTVVKGLREFFPDTCVVYELCLISELHVPITLHYLTSAKKIEELQRCFLVDGRYVTYPLKRIYNLEWNKMILI